MKRNLAWKVVRPFNVITPKLFTSCVSNHAQATYIVNEWAYPPVEGHPFLFVFRTRNDARTFRNTRLVAYNFRIFRCEVDGVIGDENWMSVLGYSRTAWPQGTMVAKSVKLLHPE